jgi:hypothetical protein
MQGICRVCRTVYVTLQVIGESFQSRQQKFFFLCTQKKKRGNRHSLKLISITYVYMFICLYVYIYIHTCMCTHVHVNKSACDGGRDGRSTCATCGISSFCFTRRPSPPLSALPCASIPLRDHTRPLRHPTHHTAAPTPSCICV